MGIGPLLLTRVGGLVAAAFIFSILVGVLVFVPFMVVGAWRRRRDAPFGPFLGYAVLLFAFSAIVSAVHVPGGTFIHSAVALAPHGYVLALEGIVAGGGAGSPRDARAGTRRRQRGCSSAARSRSACSPPSSARARSTRSWDAQAPAACRPWRRRSMPRARRRPTGSCRSTPPGTATGPATRAWCWSTTRSTPSSRSRARTGSAGSSSSPTTASRPRSEILSTTSGRPGSGRRSSRRDDVSRVPGLPRRRRPPLPDRAREHGPMSRREAWITALAVFAVALAVRVVAASIIAFPKPEDTAYYVGVARNLVEGRGPRLGRAVELRHAAARVPAARVRGLAAAAVAARRHPDGPDAAGQRPIPLETAMRAAPGGAGRRRRDRRASSPGASPRTSPWSAACRPAGRARSRSGPGSPRRSTCRCSSTRRCPTRRCCSARSSLGAALLMTRVLRDPRGARWRWTPASSGSACSSALAALTRNEAVWLALDVGLARLAACATRRAAVRLRLIAVVAVVSLLVFAPWAIRDWAVFGNPLPGQARPNALSVTGFDIFAWNDPPTLARYLAAGPGGLLEMRVVGHRPQPVQRPAAPGHPDLPPRPARAALAGPRSGPAAGPARGRADLPRDEPAVPGGDDVGHVPPRRGAGPRAAADRVRARRARRGHRRAWAADWAGRGRSRGSGPLLAIFASALFSVALLPGFGGSARCHGAHVSGAGPRRWPSIGAPLDGSAPVIHDFPIWLAETERVPTLALPDETPVGRPRPRDPLRRQVAHRRQGRARPVARGPRRAGPRRRRASRRSCCRSPPTRRTPRPSRASACSASRARAWRSRRA